MILFLIFALIVLVILMWTNIDNFHDNISVNIMEFILHCFAIIMVFGAFAVYSNSPKAIDVYRGKTTLEITYKDSIPVDSVVVFKERR